MIFKRPGATRITSALTLNFTRWLAAAAVLSYALFGCKSATQHREQADKDAAAIIAAGQQHAFGKTEQFSIVHPADILRRRLIDAQNLLVVGPASFGSDKLEPIEHWPEPDYPKQTADTPSTLANEPYPLTLLDALKVGGWASERRAPVGMAASRELTSASRAC